MRAMPDVNAVMSENRRAPASREAQFTDAFGACYHPVLAYARRRVGADLAQDVVAEAFLAAWRNFEYLPPEPLPWLYRAAHFAIANQRRAVARQGKLDERARLLADRHAVPDHSELVVADMELAAAFRSLSEADRGAAARRVGGPDSRRDRRGDRLLADGRQGPAASSPAPTLSAAPRSHAAT